MFRAMCLVAGFMVMSSAAQAAGNARDIENLDNNFVLSFETTQEVVSDLSRLGFDQHDGLTYHVLGDFENDGALQFFVNGDAQRFTAEDSRQFSSTAGVQYKLRF